MFNPRPRHPSKTWNSKKVSPKKRFLGINLQERIPGATGICLLTTFKWRGSASKSTVQPASGGATQRFGSSFLRGKRMNHTSHSVKTKSMGALQLTHPLAACFDLAGSLRPCSIICAVRDLALGAQDKTHGKCVATHGVAAAPFDSILAGSLRPASALDFFWCRRSHRGLVYLLLKGLRFERSECRRPRGARPFFLWVSRQISPSKTNKRNTQRCEHANIDARHTETRTATTTNTQAHRQTKHTHTHTHTQKQNNNTHLFEVVSNPSAGCLGWYRNAELCHIMLLGHRPRFLPDILFRS